MNDHSSTEPGLTVHASGKYLSLVQRENWEYATRVNASGVVVLVPITDDDCIVLVEQYRIPVGSKTVELPAGLVGDLDDLDESLITAAKRELFEETGYEATNWSLLLECPITAGMSDEVVTFFEARGLTKKGEGGGDESEDITVYKIPLDSVDGWLKSRLAEGIMVDPKIYSALYWVKFPDSAPCA